MIYRVNTEANCGQVILLDKLMSLKPK